MLVAAAAMVIAVNVGDLRWEEFVGGEINPAEQFAGIVAGSDALLLRNTEIVSGNHHLDVPFDLYDGEDTDGGVNVSMQKLPPYRLQMQSGILQQGSQQQVLPSQSLADRPTGCATCTLAFGRLCTEFCSSSSREPSELNTLTLPSLP